MIGTGACRAISRTSDSENAPRQPVVPMRTVGRRTRAIATGSVKSCWAEPGLGEPARIDRERSLVVGEPGPIEMDEATAIHERDRGTFGGRCRAFQAELPMKQPGDPDGGGTCAEE